MPKLEPRVTRLEAKMRISEKKMKVGEFGYATPSEIRELLAAIEAKGQACEMVGKVEARRYGPADAEDVGVPNLGASSSRT